MLCKNAIKRGGKELKIEDIKIGDLVWVYNDDISNAEYGLVTDIDQKTSKVKINGTEKVDSFMFFIVRNAEDCFLTKQSCINNHRIKLEEKVTSYKSEITDITSLIRFPLIHSFKIDKRIDQEAIRAYIEKAKEFGINIDI